MAVTVACPNPDCRTPTSIPETLLGRSLQCSRCGRTFTVSEPSTATASAQQPVQIGRFRVRARLGSGAFGTVYRAYDPQLDREVALKVPRRTVLANPQSSNRFLREARATARLRHSHIVPVYEIGFDGTYHYIVSALIQGQPLSAAFQNGPMEFRRAALIMAELAEAVGYAHEQGIVHRDLKPGNVLLDERDEPHLTDFGLAHWSNTGNKATRLGAILGTPPYIAPELAKGHQGVCAPASDQYSLGVILYQLLCGQPLFSGPPQVVLFHTIRTQPSEPRTVNPTIPAKLEAICLRALRKQPEERYASCRELAGELQAWLHARPPAIERPPAVPPVPAEPHLVTPSSVAVLVGGFALLIGAILWGITKLSAPAAAPGPELGAVANLVAIPKREPAVLEIPQVTLRSGENVAVHVRIDRAGCEGPIQLSLSGLPDRIDVQPKRLFIAADTDRLSFQLSARKDALPRAAQKVTILAQVGAHKVRRTFTLAVQLMPQSAAWPSPDPPRGEVAALGRLEQPVPPATTMLLQFDADRARWQRLQHSDKAAQVLAGRQLVSLPGFQSIVQTETGVRLILVGTLPEFFPGTPLLFESQVVLHRHAGLDLDLTLQRGRILLASTRADRPTRVRVRFDNPSNPNVREMWDLTLKDRDTAILVDHLAFFATKPASYADPGSLKRPARVTQIGVTVLNGAAQLRIGKTSHNLKAPPGPARVTWDSKKGKLTGPVTLKELESWAGLNPDPPGGLTKELAEQRLAVRRATSALSAELADRDILTELKKAAAANDPVRRRLAVRCFGALDRVSELLDALTDAKRSDVRRAAIETLAYWLAAGRAHQEQFQAEVKKRCSAAEAEKIIALLERPLLAGCSLPKTYEWLIEQLSSSQLAVRELAGWHLYAMVPEAWKDIRFDATAASQALERVQVQWRALIPRGQVPVRYLRKDQASQ